MLDITKASAEERFIIYMKSHLVLELHPLWQGFRSCVILFHML